MNARVQFWTCLNDDHRHVTWHGTTAVCDTCRLTSDMTREYDAAVRAHERRRVADHIRQTFREYHPTARDWLTERGLSAFSAPGAVAMAIAAWMTQAGAAATRSDSVD